MPIVFAAAGLSYSGRATSNSIASRPSDDTPDLFNVSKKPNDMKNEFFQWYMVCIGGEGGIRTLGTAQHRTLTFQASPFNHSGTSPFLDFLEGRQF
jgi:hypothetical protein